jgi:hypothetical protein
MRRYFLSLATIFAFCLFTAFAMAQTPGGTTGVNQNPKSNSNGSTATPNPADSSKPVTGSPTDPYSVNSGPNGRAANTGATAGNDSNSGGEKTLDGCIVREQTDYFIQPESGDRERLTGSQDLSSQVGKHVKVHGTENSNSAANNSSGSSADRTSTSGSAKSETQNNAAGSMAGNSGSSNASGTGASSNSGSNWSGKELAVTRVDSVSESCPANIQSKIDQNKSQSH